jgi:hypothetical protein
MAKIGEGHAEAMLRQGLSELRGAFYTQSNVAQSPQYGLYGTRTPGEVAEARRGDDHEHEVRSQDEETSRESVLEERLQQLDRTQEDRNREDQERDSKGFEKE